MEYKYTTLCKKWFDQNGQKWQNDKWQNDKLLKIWMSITNKHAWKANFVIFVHFDNQFILHKVLYLYSIMQNPINTAALT